MYAYYGADLEVQVERAVVSEWTPVHRRFVTVQIDVRPDEAHHHARQERDGELLHDVDERPVAFASVGAHRRPLAGLSLASGLSDGGAGDRRRPRRHRGGARRCSRRHHHHYHYHHQ